MSNRKSSSPVRLESDVSNRKSSSPVRLESDVSNRKSSSLVRLESDVSNRKSSSPVRLESDVSKRTTCSQSQHPTQSPLTSKLGSLLTNLIDSYDSYGRNNFSLTVLFVYVAPPLLDDLVLRLEVSHCSEVSVV